MEYILWILRWSKDTRPTITLPSLEGKLIGKMVKVAILGAEKTLAIYTPGRKVEYPEVQQELVPAVNTEGNIAQLGGYFSEIKYFIDSVENDQEPVQASARAARDSLEIVLAEKESAETGKIVKIGRTFKGN